MPPATSDKNALRSTMILLEAIDAPLRGHSTLDDKAGVILQASFPTRVGTVMRPSKATCRHPNGRGIENDEVFISHLSSLDARRGCASQRFDSSFAPARPPRARVGAR